MIEPDIHERMARFAPSQNVPDVPVPDFAPMGSPAPSEDEVVSSIFRDRRDDMMSSLMRASEIDPDQAAKASGIGQSAGVGQDIALRNMQELERMSFVADVERRDLPRKRPTLTDFLRDRDFAAMSRDDLDNLEKLEGSFMDDIATFYYTGTTPGMRRGYERAQAQFERAALGRKTAFKLADENDRQRIKQLNKRMAELGSPSFPLGITTEVLTQMGKSAKEIGASTVAGAVAGTMVGGPPGALAGAGAGFTLGTMATTADLTAGNLYLDLQEQGVQDDVAIPLAISGGLIGGAIEAAGSKVAVAPFKGLAAKLIQDQVSKSLAAPTVRAAALAFGKGYLAQVGTEAGEETAQAITEIAATEYAKYMSGIQSEENFYKMVGDVADAAVYGALGSAIIGGVGPGANFFADLNRVQRSTRQSEVLQRVIDVAAQSRTIQRSPDAGERYVGDLAEQANAETLFIDARVMQQVLQQAQRDDPTLTREQIESALPGVLGQLADPDALSGDVTVPTASFVAKMSRNELGRRLIPHLRIDPDMMSPADAAQWNSTIEERKREAMQILEQREAVDAAFVEEAEVVRDEIRGRAEAAGRSKELADLESLLYRDFVVTQAARRGMTPAQFHAAQGLRGVEGAMAPAMPAVPEFVAPPKPEGMDQKFYDDLIQRAIREVGGSPTIEVTRGVQSEGATVGVPRQTEANLRAAGNDAAADVYIAAAQQAANRNVAAFQARRAAAAAPNIMEQADRIDAEYMAAVERGDMETAQRMVDEAANALGFTIEAFHGTPEGGFTEFRDSPRGLFFTNKRALAAGYTYFRTPWLSPGTTPTIYRTRLRMQNPLRIDAGGARNNNIPFPGREYKRTVFGNLPAGAVSVEEAARLAFEQGHDGIIIENVMDGVTMDDKTKSTVYVIPTKEQVKSADPVTRDESGNVIPLSRRFDITSPRIFEQAAMSTRVPTAVKPLEDALNDVLLADFPAFMRDQKFVAKNLAKFKELNAPIRIDENATEQQQLEQIIEHMTSNLLWLHDSMDADIRERARMWYVGGRRLVDWMAERHGMSPMAAAAVFAVLSPQKNWYENVGLGIRITDIVATQGDATMDADMQNAYLSSLRKEVTKKKGQLAKQNEAKPKQGKKELAAWEDKRAGIADELKAAQDKVAEAQGNIDAIGKRTLAVLLKERDFFLAAIMVRWFDQTKNDRTYPVISPEGGVGSPMLTEAGTPASIRYGSYNEVSKAIAAYVDGRAENVHYLIGGEHKVRNFYNNLFNPEDPRFATIDTHAIAAAYLMPLAGTDKLVQHGLGGGVGNAMFGMGGGYAVFYEAYRRAAEARGIQPREMQSITWEAIRGMFEAAMKSGLKAPVAATWKQYVDGKIDIDTARADVMQRAGGITTPSWVALPTDMQPAAGYEGVSRTAADAQAGRIAAQPTAASVMFEVAPDPADAALVQRWEALSPQQRQAISVRVAEDIVPRILREYGVAADMVMQVGGWEGATNVGFALRMPPGPLVRQIAQSVGYALSQQAVFTLSATEFQGSDQADIIVLKLQPGTTVEQIGDLYEKKLYPLGIQGHATVQDSMIISLDPGVDGAILADTIAQAVAGDGRIAEITHATGWRSLDETRITDEAARAADEGRRTDGAAGRRRVDAYRREATRLVAEYLGPPGRYEQAAAGPARGGYDVNRWMILLGKGADATTFAHELVHYAMHLYTTAAREGTADAQTLADLDVLFQWLKVDGDTPEARLAAYLAKTFEERRPDEEAIAYNHEIYVWEGKAPSPELQGVFERLSAFFRRVYKSIRDELNAIYRREFGKDLPILTPDVRAVFDRMLASDEAIRKQQAINRMVPSFQTQAESKMTDAEWAAYLQMQREAQEAAVTDLTVASLRQTQWLSRARSRFMRDLQRKHDAKRKDVREEVAADLKVQPVYRAQAYLRTGTFVDTDGQEVKIDGPHRLDIDMVRNMYGLRERVVAKYETEEGVEVDVPTMPEEADPLRPAWERLGTGRYGMLGATGLAPDIVAEQFGFGSGDEMIRALLDAKPLKQAVEDRTDEVMLERFGDMNSPQAMEAAVQKALHNEARARFVAVELRFMAKATEPTRVLMEAARRAAKDILDNKRIKDIRPGQHVSAEARASADAMELAGKTEIPKALKDRYPTGTVNEAIIRAKRAQLYQNQLAAMALDAKEEVAKGIKYLRRVLRDENVKRMGASAADQVQQMLERFDLAQVSLKRLEERKALADWLADQKAAGLEPDLAPEVINEAFRVNYRDLTLAQFRDLVDGVKQVEYIGKNERKVQLAAERAAYEEKRDEIVTRVRAVGRLRGVKFDPRSPLTGIGRAAASLRGFAAQHLKAASVARILDGGEDDGPLWTFAIRSANAASDMETRMRAEASAKLAEILAPVFKLGNMGGKGILFPTIGRSLNREARIAIAMNLGNEGNTQRLLDGEGWTMEQVRPILESLTAAEWNAVQQVWDFLETYRPLISEKERRLYGKEPDWVEPRPITVRTADGQTLTLAGGYYPIKYDPIASDRVATVDEAAEAKRALDGAYTAATTRRSFVKSRVREVVGRPLLYTLDAAFGGVNDVIHDLAWHEWLIQTQRLLRDPEFANAVRETRGPEFLKQLRDWAKDNAAGERKVGVAGEAALSWLRQGISASGLGFNVVSAAMQVTGFNQSIVRLGAKYVGRGVAQFAGSPIDTARMVADKSSFMAERGRTQFREINEIKNRVRGQTEVARRVTAGTYFLMMNMQRTVDIPTWLAGYQKALDAGKDDATAVALADQAVRDTQGSGLISDLSAIERGGPMIKLFTVFYSYMNTVYNMTAVQTMTARSKGKLAADYAMLLVVPVVLGQAIKNLIQPDAGDDELDPEALARKLAAEELSFLMGTMVIVREFGGAAQLLTGAEGVRMGYGGPAGLRAVGEVYGLATQAGQLEFDRAFRRSAINTLGAFTGLPSAQVNRTIDGIEAVVEGEVEGVGAVVAPLTGVQR